MNASKAAHIIRPRHIVMVISVLISCFLLFSLDKDTHSLADLFKPGNLFALILYFIPTYAVCLLLNALFEHRHLNRSMLWSLILGIPLGFTLVIATLLALKP